MSIAWGSIVLLVVLLPGILFFVGLYLPDKFTREAEAPTALGQLGAALLVSLVVHGLWFWLSGYLCGRTFPCIDLGILFQAVSLDSNAPEAIRAVSDNVLHHRGWILTYVLASSLAGVGVGYFYGRIVSVRRWHGLSRHSWVYDLSVDGLTYGYVLTHVRHEHRILMYKGVLRAFGLQKDGRFSYIVLAEAARLYLRLEDLTPVTSDAASHRAIGGSRSDRPASSLFVIEGEDIANAVFDVLAIKHEAVSDAEVSRIAREEAAAIGYDLPVEGFGTPPAADEEDR